MRSASDIDAELTAGDVRLTMGGEPTFVSIDDMDGVEWNFTALGTDKRHLAGALVRRLKQRFAPGGLLHFGQGKWYPGESLPRWALGCWWRRDGVPIWNDDSLDRRRDGRLRLRRRRSADASSWRWPTRWAWTRRMSSRPTRTSGTTSARERRLPVNVDPLKSELKNEEERARLARVFEQGLDRVVGYVLPVKRRRESERARWMSGRVVPALASTCS